MKLFNQKKIIAKEVVVKLGKLKIGSAKFYNLQILSKMKD